jgi:hypothetical protein
VHKLLQDVKRERPLGHLFDDLLDKIEKNKRTIVQFAIGQGYGKDQTLTSGIAIFIV